MKRFLHIFRYHKKASWLFESRPILVWDRFHNDYRLYESCETLNSEMYQILHKF